MAKKAKKAKKKSIVAAPSVERNKRRRITGTVVSDKMDKTIKVKIDRMVRHPRFRKYMKRFTICKAHDEKNEAKMGDVVELMETRPMSATKRWRLLRFLRKETVPAAADTPAS